MGTNFGGHISKSKQAPVELSEPGGNWVHNAAVHLHAQLRPKKGATETRIMPPPPVYHRWLSSKNTAGDHLG